ncbi:Ty3/gypsy retrotransposon protein [Senna tora]|uniref:Ty3/gypsy retrotransposon protein n=1 Tax=Senna tora TaxID=362788 RepID=A0A834X025_9FABA|nr:Ty3/gypsy retrotransposon protein [Senna tora]
MAERTRFSRLEAALTELQNTCILNRMVDLEQEFLEALLLHFGTTLYDSPRVALKHLRQTSTVAEYQAKFEDLSTKVNGLSEEWLINMFIARMSDNLRSESNFNSSFKGKQVVASTSTGNSSTLTFGSNVAGPSNSNTPAYKRFSTAELRARREKEELAEIIEAQGEELEADNLTNEEAEEVVLEISFNALERQYHPSTLRLIGHCGDHMLNILVDNGSTQNIVEASLVETLGLPKTAIVPFWVLTGSGTALTCTHKCDKVSLMVQGYELVVDLFVLEIKDSDVVLRVQWLAELGEVMTNYKDLTMSFGQGGKQQIEQDSTWTAVKVPAEIMQILEQYSAVFAEPKALPPHREVDHHIVLELGAKPVSIRLYRYPHFQKAEIECLVAEMKDLVMRDGKEVVQVLVEWQGVPRKEATWEDWSLLLKVFADIDLEDKVIFDNGGNDAHACQRPTLDAEMKPNLEGSPKSERVRTLPHWTRDFELTNLESKKGK